MRHSKIVLGVVTSCLAVAGVFAAKAHHNSIKINGYYTSAIGHCTAVSNGFWTANVTNATANQHFAKHGSSTLRTSPTTGGPCGLRPKLYFVAVQ